MESKLTERRISILMPPPNVTGALHLGHALNNFLQDALVRYHFLRNDQTVWIPGFDHAGIATEIMVRKWIASKRLQVKNKAEYAQLFKQWTSEQQAKIRQQWKKLDLKINPEYETFTLEPAFQKVVLEAFVHLYAKQLIYRAETLVNWDPSLQTAIADIEVEHRQQAATLYYFKYQLADDHKDYLLIATTRPETIFADQAVIVNPNDKRYQKYHNRHVINPFNQQKLPILVDSKIALDFGSGVLKCTPGHDWTDWELGQKFQLKAINCFDQKGRLNASGLQYAKQDRFQARQAMVKAGWKTGLIVKSEIYEQQIPYSSRSGVVVEPMLSTQWFLKTKQWGQALRKNQQQLQIQPEKYRKYLINWLEKMHDWCISRQLQWGHQLPVYFHRQTKAIKVSKTPLPTQTWKRSTDVLDTWFSSALWAVANFGWKFPGREKIKHLYPITYLVTSYDIIFFWVLKMIFFGIEFQQQLPFKKIIIHGLIRAENKLKMSKSRGNVVDPMHLIDRYGIDGLRWLFLTGYKIGDDWQFETEKLVQAQQFVHKIHHIGKFLRGFCPAEETKKLTTIQHPFNAWLLEELQLVVKKYESYFPKLQFTLIGELLHDFIGKKFSNFYLRFAKGLKTGEAKAETIAFLQLVWKRLLYLLHPFISQSSSQLFKQMFGTKLSPNEREKMRWPKNTCQSTMGQVYETILRQSLVLNQKKRDHNREKLILETEVALAEKEIANLNDLLATQNFSIGKVKNAKLTKLQMENPKEKADQAMVAAKIAFFEAEVARSEKILDNQSFLANAKPAIVKVEQLKYLQYKKELKFWKAKLKF